MIVCQDELKDHLRGGATTICLCVLVQFRPLPNGDAGEVRAFTMLNRDVTFDLAAWMVSMGLDPPPGIAGTGSQTYVASRSQIPSDVAGAADLSPENLELDGALDLPSWTEAEINAGVWDFASMCLFIVNYEDLSMGALIMRCGKIGEMTIERNNVKAEFRGVSQAYSRIIVRLLSPGCSWNLGDANCGVNMEAEPVEWEPSTGYTASTNTIVTPTTPDGNWYICLTGGTSDAIEPTWNTVQGGVTEDGDVRWLTSSARLVSGTVTAVRGDSVTFESTDLTQPGPQDPVNIVSISKANPGVVTTDVPLGLSNGAPVTQYGIGGMVALNGDTFIHNPSGNTYELGVDTTSYPTYSGGGKVVPLGGSSGYFSYGIVTWLTGDNTGYQMEVKNYVPGQISLQLPMPNPIQIGDTFSVTVGCGKAFETDCRDKFGNQLRFGGFPYLPGIDRLILVGKQL